MSLDRATTQAGQVSKEPSNEPKVPPIITLTADRIKHYMTDSEITARREGIANLATLTDRRSSISILEAEDSLPVLIRILLEIQQVLMLNQKLEAQRRATIETESNFTDERFENTQIALKKALSIFGEADRILVALKALSAINLPGKYALVKHISKEGTLQGLEDLINSAKTIQITKETRDLWMEVSTYLYGIYWRTAHHFDIDDAGMPMVEKSGRRAGKYKTVDLTDDFFLARTGLTKIEVSLFYLQVSKMIDNLVQQFEQTHEVRDVSRLVTQIKNVEAAAPGTPISGVIPYQMSIDDEGECASFRLTVANKDKQMLQFFCDYTKSVFDYPLQRQLKEDVYEEPAVRISNFRIALEEHGFNPIDAGKLKYFKEEANKVLQGYIDSTGALNPASYLPSSIGSIFGRTHSTLATTAQTKLKSTGNNVKEQVLIISGLYFDLTGKDSKTLQPLLLNLLMKVIHIICPNMPATMLRQDSNSNFVGSKPNRMI